MKYGFSSLLWKTYRNIVSFRTIVVCLCSVFCLVVKHQMKVATNLLEIVTVAGFQPWKNFTAYFWTIALIYVTTTTTTMVVMMVMRAPVGHLKSKLDCQI